MDCQGQGYVHALLSHFIRLSTLLDAVGNLTEGEYEPKPFTDDDVDIAITVSLELSKSAPCPDTFFSTAVSVVLTSTSCVADGELPSILRSVVNDATTWLARLTVCFQVVGHEIAGIAVRVGASVKHIKVGDRVGVGAQSGSCQRCDDCDAHREPYCTGGYAH
jgi:hypothetical protein